RATATGQATTAQPVSPLLALTRGGQCGPAAWGFPAPGPCPSADDRHGARLAQRDAACLKISLEVPEDSQRILCEDVTLHGSHSTPPGLREAPMAARFPGVPPRPLPPSGPPAAVPAGGTMSRP